MKKFDRWLLIRESEVSEEDVEIMSHAMDQIGKVLDDYQATMVNHVNTVSSQRDDMEKMHAAATAPEVPEPTPEPAAPAAPKPGAARRFLGNVASKLGSAVDTKDASGLQKNNGRMAANGLRDTLGGWLKGAASKLRREEFIDFEALEAAILEYVRDENELLVENEELRMATAQMRASVMNILKSALTAMYNSASTLHKYKAPGIGSLGTPTSQARKYHAWQTAKDANPEFADPEPAMRGAEKVKQKVKRHIAAQQKPGPDSIRGSWLR
jgi:hypothetical protein